jgi:hypothetical protein
MHDKEVVNNPVLRRTRQALQRYYHMAKKNKKGKKEPSSRTARTRIPYLAAPLLHRWSLRGSIHMAEWLEPKE